MDWNQLTEKQKMEWYQEQFKKLFPDWTLCKLDFLNGHWIVRVKCSSWAKTTSATIKKITDADHLWNKQHNPDFTQKQQLHLDIEIPFNKPKAKGKIYKTISCSVDLDFYNNIDKFVKYHNMTINQLLVMLLKKVIPNETKKI